MWNRSFYKWQSFINLIEKCFHTDDRKLYENRKVNQASEVSLTTLTRRNRHQYNERDWHSFDTNLNIDTDIANMKNKPVGLAETIEEQIMKELL